MIVPHNTIQMENHNHVHRSIAKCVKKKSTLAQMVVRVATVVKAPMVLMEIMAR
ncbi:hypothetical protein D3C87_1789840 [compost metagenome]